MSGRYVRSQTAQRVTDLIGTREGRKHLESHGWVQGMPIVMAHTSELLDDVLGLVSVRMGPTFIAALEPETGALRFLHVSEPNAALIPVPVSAPDATIWELFTAAAATGTTTFRSKYAMHSAVAHLIPAYTPAAGAGMFGYRHETVRSGGFNAAKMPSSVDLAAG